MKKDLRQERRRRNRLRWILACLALVVILGTSYAMMLPAITMSRETYCGLEAHVHTDDCYAVHTVLVCREPYSEEHIHDASCYETVEELICVRPTHYHGALCYIDPDALNAATNERPLEEPFYNERFTDEQADEYNPVQDLPSQDLPDEDQPDAEQPDEEQPDGEDPADEQSDGEEPAEETEPRDKIESPAFHFEDEAGDLHVVVDAPKGAFPADTVMSVSLVVSSAILDAVADSVAGQVGGIQAVDIVFEHEGEEIEPAVPIRVTFTSPLISNMDEVAVVHVDDAGGVTVVDTDEPDSAGSAVSFESDTFSIYALIGTIIEQTVLAGDGHNYKITVTCDPEAGVPSDAELEVTELLAEDCDGYLGRAMSFMEAADFEYARVFDISILDRNGRKIQPDAPVEVSIELLDADGSAEDFSVVHFRGIDERPERIDTETDGNVVSFRAEGFSAYAIVQGPEPIPLGWHKVETIAELISRGSTGLYVGHPDGYYYGGHLVTDASRSGIFKTKPAKDYPPTDAAVKYYFEQVGGSDNQVYAYCYATDGVTKQYVYNGNNNSLSFTADAETAFTVTKNNDGSFKLNNGNWYWNMQGGKNGERFCAYNTANDTNNRVDFWYYEEAPSDPYGLNGQTYGLMFWTGGVAGKALMASEGSDNTLEAKSLTVMSTLDNSKQLFVPDNSDISLWTFQWAGDDRYYLTAVSDGSTKYLKIDANGLSLVSDVNEASQVQVVPGAGLHAGEICLKVGGSILTYSGSIDTGFTVGGIVGSEWLHFVELSELTDEYFMTYSASKVSVSDPSVTNASRIIVYTRVWNETSKKYDFYAIDHDGSLVPVYESGDTIEWVGSRLNSMLWNFVEYYWEGTTDPNFYYELYNQFSEKYIAPQVVGGQILSDSTIGVNMNGRRDGRYYTTILAWDDKNYSYVGIGADVENGTIVSCPMAQADDFYFAIVQDLNVDDNLTTVPTVDHTQYGITMKIKDFSTRAQMSDFLDNDEGGAVTRTVPGLLSTNLGDNGYPTAASGSLATLFAGAEDVNHLFIESTYLASGYYEFDSAQNFASLKGATGGDFTVYKELGSYDSAGGRNTLKHGQFFPFNDLQPGVFASVNGKNLYSTTGAALPNGDPRKNEQLYSVEHDQVDVNCYFGVELEASFTQTPSGKDDWGHDIIFEFTGDDDFWLYVDGELIIDLGGIHSAIPGSVNFCTGDVYVNGVHYTLRQLFESNYRGRNPGATEAEVAAFLADYFDEGSAIFSDNTNHTMRIFYMERGAGASNLHMRFNLASIKPGTVELTKELSGVDQTESVLAEFPYQIKYKLKDSDEEHYLTNAHSVDPNYNTDYVFYKDSVTPVTFLPELTIGDVTYQDVFILKPGETVEINFPVFGVDNESIASYSIVECGVDTEVYSSVKVNNEEIDGFTGPDYHDNRADYETGYQSTDKRARVAFNNEVNPEALRTLTIKKTLFREDGRTEISAEEDPTTFSFRLYLGTEFEETPDAAYMHIYHVKDSDGNYCRWNADQQMFESIGIADYSALSDEQKTAASFGTSINGSISKIPAGYEVEVRNVLAGIRFQVVERPSEMPDGYSFLRYEYPKEGYTGNTTDAMAGVSDIVTAGMDPNIDVCNIRGFGLRVNKIWTDADYMEDRDPIYFALYARDDDDSLILVEDSVRRMEYGTDTLYWYYLNLPVNGVTDLSRYEIREVIVGDDPAIDSNGVVDYHSITDYIGEGENVRLSGLQIGESTPGMFDYTVSYTKGEPNSVSRVRVDTVTNDRPGVVLKKTDWAGEPLAGARFTLQADDTLIGTYTSDEEGLITVAFLSEGKEYTLTETRTPHGYRGLESPMTISLNNGTVTVSGVDDEYFILTPQSADSPLTLTVKNHPDVFRAVKIDSETNAPLRGVEFALHREITVDGVISIDLNPMPGYGSLVTDADGVIPGIDNHLPAGTYELREKTAASGYEPLSAYIQFTVGETGNVTLRSGPSDVRMTVVTDTDGLISYVLTIPNHRYASVSLRKTDNSGQLLTGAKFQLCKYGSSWETVSDYEEIDMTSNAEVALSDLPAGRYRLTELNAPEGYVILNNTVYFNISFDPSGAVTVTLTDEGGSGSNTNASASVEGTVITVVNTSGAGLPSTGGLGTFLYTFGGLLLLLTAAFVYCFRMRRRERGRPDGL